MSSHVEEYSKYTAGCRINHEKTWTNSLVSLCLLYWYHNVQSLSLNILFPPEYDGTSLQVQIESVLIGCESSISEFCYDF